MTSDPDLLTRLLIVERRLDELDAENTRIVVEKMDLRRENERLQAMIDDRDSHDGYLYQEWQKQWRPTPDERRE